MGIAPSRANLEGVRAKQGRKNEGPSSALLQRYITLLTHFGDPATDLDSFAGPPERSSATLKWSVAEEPKPGILAYRYARLPPPSRWPREQPVANFRPSSLRVFLSVLIRVHLWPILVLWVSRSPAEAVTGIHDEGNSQRDHIEKRTGNLRSDWGFGSFDVRQVAC